MANKKLNNQEQIFADQYLISHNAYQAAKVAKYAESTALKKSGLWVGYNRNNPKPHVAAYIQAKITKMSEKAGKTAQDVIDDIIDTHKRAKAVDDFKSELKASDMLNKHFGNYAADNAQIKPNVELIINGMKPLGNNPK